MPLKDSSATTPSLWLGRLQHHTVAAAGLLRRLTNAASKGSLGHHVLAAPRTSPTPRRHRCKNLSDLSNTTPSPLQGPLRHRNCRRGKIHGPLHHSHHLKDCSATMPTKVAVKEPCPEPPLHPYEALSLQQCMRNAARLQQLGIPNLVNSLANSRSTTADKNKRNHRSSEASDDEYDPSHDDTIEEDLFADHRPKQGLKDPKKTCKKSNKKTVHMPPGGIRPRSKRVFAEQQTTRTTRQKTSIAPSNSSEVNLTPQDTHVSVEADGLV